MQETPGSKMESLVCGILQFLAASPGTLRQDTLENSMVGPFLLSVLSPNPSVRHLATRVAEALFQTSTGNGSQIGEDFVLDSPELRKDIWARSSLPTVST